MDSNTVQIITALFVAINTMVYIPVFQYVIKIEKRLTVLETIEELEGKN